MDSVPIIDFLYHTPDSDDRTETSDNLLTYLINISGTKLFHFFYFSVGDWQILEFHVAHIVTTSFNININLIVHNINHGKIIFCAITHVSII